MGGLCPGKRTKRAMFIIMRWRVPCLVKWSQPPSGKIKLGVTGYSQWHHNWKTDRYYNLWFYMSGGSAGGTAGGSARLGRGSAGLGRGLGRGLDRARQGARQGAGQGWAGLGRGLAGGSARLDRGLNSSCHLRLYKEL
ncbi:hypothetical protein ACLB2K_017327 [Fragaria x ananassa]